jgi:hypothetical protein
MRTLILLGVLAPLCAQQPRLIDAKVETRAVASGLDKEIQAIVSQQADPAWIGYSVPAVAGHNWDGHCTGTLENRNRTTTVVNRSGAVLLEGSGHLTVLIRVDHKQVDKIRSFPMDCELDAGGLTVYWLTGVKPAESVAWLTPMVGTFAQNSEKRGPGEGALSAIAQHADASADQAMERFVAAGQPETLREKATFWLGEARGRRGYEVLKRLLTEDSSDRVREKIIFALSVSHVPDALTTMIAVAKNDRSAHVRGQALFWLAQKAGKKEVAAISEAIENDPDTEVKKKAVFALQQLPPDEGVPKLIEVARTNRNPAVRKQAMFWLGQSHDARAAKFFEEVLTK